ncbi:MAG: hypothetical protein Ct9H300mP28_13410 [Pseudomonadota bacterium]|nr:MAG: hypothetical protein Ct9H300mP28_13410 [Pseudomonadota bacterium]
MRFKRTNAGKTWFYTFFVLCRVKAGQGEREGEALGFMENLTLTLARKIIFKKVLNRFGGKIYALLLAEPVL